MASCAKRVKPVSVPSVRPSLLLCDEPNESPQARSYPWKHRACVTRRTATRVCTWFSTSPPCGRGILAIFVIGSKPDRAAGQRHAPATQASLAVRSPANCTRHVTGSATQAGRTHLHCQRTRAAALSLPFPTRAALVRDDLPQVVSLPNRASKPPWPCSEFYNRDATGDARQLVNDNITCG